eukprot:4213440-Pyramimonas_sp.AAC.1
MTTCEDGIGVSADSIGVSVDGKGVSVDSIGVSVDGIEVSVDSIGVSVDGIGVTRPQRLSRMLTARRRSARGSLLVTFTFGHFQALESLEAQVAATWARMAEVTKEADELQGALAAMEQQRASSR